MTWPAVLAKIKTELEAVTNIGQVYDNIRHVKDEDILRKDFTITIGGQQEIRVWFITREGGVDAYGSMQALTGTRVSLPVRRRGRRYDVVIEGIESFKDDSTEVDFQALVTALLDQLKDNLTFGQTVLERGAISYEITHTMFGETLCHHVLMRFYCIELDAITPS